MERNILITGKPGCGKTTLIKKLIDEFKHSASGFYTEEIREDGKRVGFRIVGLNGKKAIFAHVKIHGPRIAKYGIDVKKLEDVGLSSIDLRTKLIFIDEIGKMELLSRKLEKKILDALKKKKVVGSLHRGYVARFSQYGDVFLLSRENFDDVYQKVRKKILEQL